MDKLELDARVARLERNMTFLAAVVAAALLGVGVLLTFSLRTSVSMSAPASISQPALPPTSTTVTTIAAPRFAVAVRPTTPDWANQLRTLHDLYDKGAINSIERDAEKEKLLAGTISAGDMKTDLETVKELSDRGIINSFDRDRLKQKPLSTTRRRD